MPLTAEEKLDAKVANEGTKLLATLINTLGGGTLLGGIITPIVVYRQLDPWWAIFSLGGAAALHVLARVILFELKPEE